jgi:MFS family permease
MIANYVQRLRQLDRDVWLYLFVWATIGFAYSGVYLVLFNLYLVRLGYGHEFVGVVNGVGLVAMALFSVPAGTLGRRWGTRRMMIAGMALMTIGFVAVPLAELVPLSLRSAWFVMMWCLVSFSAPLFTVNSAPFLMAVTGPEERDYAFSLQGAVFAFAGFGGGLVAGLLPGFIARALTLSLDKPAPFRYGLFLAGAAYIVGFLVLLATRKGDGVQERVKGVASGADRTIPLALISIMAIVMVLRATGEWAPNVYFNVYMDIGLDASTVLIGSFVAVARLGSGVAALLMPVLVGLWGKERVIGWGTIGGAVCLLPMVFVPQWGAAGIGFVGAIALSALVVTAYYVYGQELVTPNWQAVMSGAIWMGGGVGGALILIAGGRIITAYGFSSLFLTAAVLTTLGGVLFLSYFRMPRREIAQLPSH